MSKLFDIIKSTRAELSALSAGQQAHAVTSTDVSPHVAKIMWCKTSSEKVGFVYAPTGSQIRHFLKCSFVTLLQSYVIRSETFQTRQNL